MKQDSFWSQELNNIDKNLIFFWGASKHLKGVGCE